MVLSVATEKIPRTPSGIEPETVRLVAQCLNHYATPGPPRYIHTARQKFKPAVTRKRAGPSTFLTDSPRYPRHVVLSDQAGG
jgi:hypothetical protein